MTNETEKTPEQPNTDQQVKPPQQKSPEDWEARYKGTGATINALNEQIKTLTGQLETKSSELEQLRAELSLKDTEKNVAIGERDKRINTYLEEKSQTDSELKRLRALEAKVKVANKIGDTTLVTIFDSIPDVESEETLETLMNQISTYATDRVKQRESEILAGVIDEPSSTTQVSEPLPTTVQGWQKYVDKFELGTPERDKAFNAWRDWGIASQQ